MKLENLNSNNQVNLYGHEELFLNIANLYDNNRLPNSILFSGLSGIGKATFAYHLINYIFSKNEEYLYDIKNFNTSTQFSYSYDIVFKKSIIIIL